MAAWRLNQEGIERIKVKMQKFKRDQDGMMGTDTKQFMNFGVSTKRLGPVLSDSGLFRADSVRASERTREDSLRDLDFLHDLVEEVAGMVHKGSSKPPKNTSQKGGELEGKMKEVGFIFPRISTRRAAVVWKETHQESPSWEVDPGTDSFQFVNKSARD